MPSLTLRSERGTELCLDHPILMGILNVTPDSFSDGGHLVTTAAALHRARELLDAGAGILDIGGESTRPGAPSVDEATELSRVIPTIEALVREGIDVPISIDTQKPLVARAALEAGADIINDVSAFAADGMAAVAAQSGALVVLMHMRGNPKTMQAGPIHYDDATAEVADYLRERIAFASAAGVSPQRIITDPGIGFGKELEHNLSLTKHLGALTELGCPVLFGPSRKRFLGEITGRDVSDRDRATAAVCAAAVLAGASILRVHDVAAVSDAVAIAHAIRTAS